MLIKCSACKKDVSKQAKNCPHCGQPMATGSSIVLSLLATIVTLIIIAWAWQGVANAGKEMERADKQLIETLKAIK